MKISSFVLFKSASVLSICLCLTSCLSGINKNVTNNQSYWGGYKPDTVYALAEDVFLFTRNNYLLSERGYDKESDLKELKINWPSTFENYSKSPDIYPEFKILKKGLRLKCTEILFVDNLTWSYINVLGIILEGDYKNATVYLEHLSIAANDSPEKGVADSSSKCNS